MNLETGRERTDMDKPRLLFYSVDWLSLPVEEWIPSVAIIEEVGPTVLEWARDGVRVC